MKDLVSKYVGMSVGSMSVGPFLYPGIAKPSGADA